LGAAKLNADLTQQEIEAAVAYGVESKLFHACWQGRANEVCYHPDYLKFANTYQAITGNLDTAIAKSILATSLTVFSGYPRGYSILGSLTGNVENFVGLCYQYPGFISTSQSKLIAEDKFLRVGAARGTRPTLLQFNLTEGESALDMNMVGHQGEIEYLLPRNQLFRIVGAEQIGVQDVEDAALHLVLRSR
jgi:hypothetical protein